MIIGWHSWEPGLQGNVKTSAGGAAWTAFLFKKFIEAGNTIVWLGSDPLPENTVLGNVKDCDALVLCWRWSMPQYPERHAAYLRQRNLLQLAERFNIPVLVHDEDYKISDTDMADLRWLGATVARPELRPLSGIKSLLFPNPYPLPDPELAGMGEYDFTYVGNNYERYAQVKRFFGPIQDRARIRIFGNWLEPNPNRESPEQVATDFPKIEFPGRLEQEKVIETLRNSKATVNFFKPEYGMTSFVTIRVAEAAAAGIPTFFPANFMLPWPVRGEYASAGLLIDNAEELFAQFAAMVETPDLWRLAVDMQQLFVKAYMRWDNWLDLIANLPKGK